MKRFLILIAVLFGTGQAVAQSANCPAKSAALDIPASTDPATRLAQRNQLVAALQTPNTIIRLEAGADLDFSDVPDALLPIHLGRCVTLTSVAYFGGVNAPPQSHSAGRAPDAKQAARLRISLPPIGLPPLPPGRTPHSTGPVLRYGQHPDRPTRSSFLEATCGGGLDGEGARFSGFRLFGRSFGLQSTFEAGIRVLGCKDVEIANMEIAGWGGAAVDVEAPTGQTSIPANDPTQVSVLVHDNYLHNNQHAPDDSSEGYGVDTGAAAWSKIYNNLFDLNKHSVTASGSAGGYAASDNLILKGGGIHGAFGEPYIQVFDVHGTDHCLAGSHAFNCGNAGRTFSFLANTFQYTKTLDLKIRGKPTNIATIDQNVFALWGQGTAIGLWTNDNVTIGQNNTYNDDTFGKYSVCDFDGDGVDDLFLATGQTWWFSSGGQFPWSFLRADQIHPENLRFGYFDGDAKCDVLTELPLGTGQWFIASGGSTDWKPLGDFGHPLAEVQFGRFDPAIQDRRPNATRQTTHAFWRRNDGAWFVTPLSNVDWQPAGSSSFPLAALRFGDFTGDGVTDVLAVENGHWSISESARGSWRTLNATLNDPVANLYIGNMDTDDNIDDILRLDRQVSEEQLNFRMYEHVVLTWWRSKNGTGPWTRLRSDQYVYPKGDPEYVPVSLGFVGRFGTGAAASTMDIDASRMGRFVGAPQGGVPARWVSLFAY